MQKYTAILMGVIGVGALVSTAQATTLGLWGFEETIVFDADTATGFSFVDTTPPADPEDPDDGGQQTLDSSGNNRHITRTQPFGTFLPDRVDVPSIMAPDSFSALMRSGGESNLRTPNGGDVFSAAVTGELTVEFWFKPHPEVAVNTAMFLVGQTGEINGLEGLWWVAMRNLGPDKSVFGFQVGHRNVSGTGIQLNTVETLPVSILDPGPWRHFAFTIDAAGTGTVYVDGQLFDSMAGFVNMGTALASDPLVLGETPGSGGAFAGFANIDDLRISDVALLPGSGTGIDELAWNAQLVAPVPIILEGDLDGDGFVGIADLNIVLGAWNQTVPPGDPLADPSGDGFVGIADLNVVLGNWNAGTPPATGAVPEPASLALLCTGFAFSLKRRLV